MSTNRLKGPNPEEFIFGELAGQSDLSAVLNEAETTITVSWVGGGHIKNDNEGGRLILSSKPLSLSAMV
ncbi:hypothetical protein F4801DRAFT_571075 [Xylaria longipes]|nr:hypothetical protein F4801DRAFT_571075 [Xylaria longipes]